jgi:hypothetical protein
MNLKAASGVLPTLLVLGLCAALTVQAKSQARHPAKSKDYRFDTVDYPGTGCSFIWDFNTARKTVLGDFRTTSEDAVATGFTFKGTTYKSLAVSGATSTDPRGIDGSGQVVGFYWDSGENSIHGFLDSGGKFTTLDYPGAEGTEPLGINDSGSIVEAWFPASQIFMGFLYENGNYSLLNYPGASETIATGINSTGEIVGAWSAGSHGMVSAE